MPAGDPAGYLPSVARARKRRKPTTLQKTPNVAVGTGRLAKPGAPKAKSPVPLVRGVADLPFVPKSRRKARRSA